MLVFVVAASLLTRNMHVHCAVRLLVHGEAAWSCLNGGLDVVVAQQELGANFVCMVAAVHHSEQVFLQLISLGNQGTF